MQLFSATSGGGHSEPLPGVVGGAAERATRDSVPGAPDWEVGSRGAQDVGDPWREKESTSTCHPAPALSPRFAGAARERARGWRRQVSWLHAKGVVALERLTFN